MYENIHEIHVPNEFGSEKIAMERIASEAKKLGFSPKRIEDLKTAVSEACLNAMEHGNKMNTSTKVDVYLSINRKKLKVAVGDNGKGIKKEIETPNIDEKIEGKGNTRGWGLFIIKNLIEDVTYESKSDGGNILTMVIHTDRETEC